MAHPETTEALEQQIAKLGDQSIGVEADASKLTDLQMLVDKAENAFGQLDMMVNNAGVETRSSILDTTEAQYDRVMAINLKSAFFGTQIAARQMIKQGSGGRIIKLGARGLAYARQHPLLPVERCHAHADTNGRGRAR
jgi:glucose 1-dehydrogenase